MKRHTWKQWARTCVRDSSSPSALTRQALASLTGQDTAALDAIAACWDLYARSDVQGQRAALKAVRDLLPAMQSKTRWIARELIPYALEWSDRERLWPEVYCFSEVWDSVPAQPTVQQRPKQN